MISHSDLAGCPRTSRQSKTCPCRTGAIAALVLFSISSLPCGLQAQSDNFNDGNDSGWTRYDPLGDLGLGPQATFTFPDGGYRIRATKNPQLPPEVSVARAGSLRQDVTYTNFYVAVDLVKWDDTVRQAFGILARVDTPGLGTTRGYAFTYERGSGVTPTSGDLDISTLTGEQPDGVTTGPSAIHLDATKQYRFVFIGKGPNLEGRVYELPDTTTPLISIMGTDSTYASGTAGLVIYDNSGTAGPINPDATFDNYFATDVEPPHLLVSINTFGEAAVCWTNPGPAFVLQGAATLPSTSWTDLPGPYFSDGDKLCYTDPAATGIRFFRLRR